MKSGSRAQQKAMTAAEFAAHCGSLTIQTTATATQTAQIAPIPAGEGKDTAPEASGLVASLENLVNCVGIVAEVATVERANAELVATTDAQLQDLAAEIERIRNTLAKLTK